MGKISINLNNMELQVDEDKNILQLALENNIEIPHLCYDERIKPYGACGLCMVEIEGNSKLQRACSTKPLEGMVIKTKTKRLRDTRKEALKLLCSDHRGDCRPACMLACPGKTDCQGYVGLIANGEYKEALKLAKENIPLPASIGRVCPHPCETACRRQMVDEPIAIAALKSFIADLDIENDTYIPKVKASTGKRVAVVGAGPSGLSCAYYLAKKGHKVNIYEAMPKPGGMLRYGIPEYRLPKEVLDKEIAVIGKMGVNFIYNTKIGTNISLEYLRQQYNSVFLGIGAWESSKLGCKGEDAEGVIGGIDFLRKVASNEVVALGKKVIVVGGGNTAMDVCRTAVRLGADEVKVIYRRSKEEMPAEYIEVIEAEEEGVSFEFLFAPTEVILKEDKAVALKCQKMRLGQPDANGRRKPMPIEGEEQIFEADTIISAIGQKINSTGIKDIDILKSGALKIEEGTYMTSLQGVFAGGDAVTGPYIAIAAIGHGRICAELIDSYLNGVVKKSTEPFYVKQEDFEREDFEDINIVERVKIKTLPVDFRKKNFSEINKTFTEEEARKESERCLECGCMDYFECELYKYINEYEVNPQEYKGERPKHKTVKEHNFIVRNQDKCVLCGLCIRACEELVGVSALGLVNRGFDSIVMPEFGLKLKDSSCISCGECVNVCPTGACIEKESVLKQVPVNCESYESICGYCSVGCKLKYEVKGSGVLRAMPIKDQMLCVKGKFGLDYTNSTERAFVNILKQRGEESVNYKEAQLYFVKMLQSVNARYGKDSIAFAASPRFSNEELFIIKQLADKFNTSLLASFTNYEKQNLENIIGYEGSTNSYEELNSTELILSFGAVAENHPVLGIKLKDAVSSKTKLVSVSADQTRLQQWAVEAFNPDDDINFVKAFIKVLIELKYIDIRDIQNQICNYEAFEAFISEARTNEQEYKLAKLFGEAKKTIIVMDEETVSSSAIELLTLAARLTGKIGKPHRGILIAGRKSNSQGLRDMGFYYSGKEIIKKLEQGELKALVVFGEDPAGACENLAASLKNLDCLITFDLFKTRTAESSDLFITLSSSIEGNGSYTSADRKVQFVYDSLKNKKVNTTFEVLISLLSSLGFETNSMCRIVKRISSEVAGYESMLSSYENRKSFYTYNKTSLSDQELYKLNRNINFNIPIDNKMFIKQKVFDSIERYWLTLGKGE